MPGPRKTRRLEAKAPAAVRIPGAASLPDVIVRYVLSHLSARCLFRAAQTCRAMRGHSLQPSASPHAVEWSGRTCGGLVPESLLRLRPRDLTVGSSHRVHQHDLDTICARMGGTLRRLVVDRAFSVSMAGLSTLTQLRHLAVGKDWSYVTDVAALRHLTQLVALHVPIGLMDMHHVPDSCRELTVDTTDLNGPGRRAAWLQVLQRPLTALTLDDIGGSTDGGRIAEIGAHCRTLHTLHMEQCQDVAPLAALPLLTDLSYEPVPETGAADGLGRLTQLRRLVLCGHEDDTPRVGGLECLSALVNLTELRLEGYPASAADVGHLCAARCTALTSLDLRVYEDDAMRLDIRPLSALSTLVNLGIWGHCTTAPLLRADWPHPLPRLERLRALPREHIGVHRSELGRLYPALKAVNPDS